MDFFTLDELSTLTEDQAVRNRADNLNLRAIKRVLFCFWLIAPINLAESIGEESLAGVILASLNLVLAPFFIVALGRPRPRTRPMRWLRRHLEPLTRLLKRYGRGSVVGLLIAQFLISSGGAFFGGDAGWLLLFCFVVAFFRLTTAEFLLVFLLIAVSGLLSFALLPLLYGESPELEELIVGQIMNLVAAGMAFFFTWRFRKRWRRFWGEARDEHKDQLRMRDEIDAARQIQLSMLPSTAPDLHWLEIEAFSLPATEVGGDYYDYVRLDEDRLVVAAGDVAGHGLASGLLLAGLRSCLTLLTADLADPKAVMEKLNYMVRQTSRQRMLVTLALVLFDRRNRSLSVTSAGHPPVLRRRGRDGEVEMIDFVSLPLGTQLPQSFPSRSIPFEVGDTFLIYTDGLYEAVDGDEEPYGLERLRDLLKDQPPGASPALIGERLRADLRAFTGRDQQEDDITWVVAHARA